MKKRLNIVGHWNLPPFVSEKEPSCVGWRKGWLKMFNQHYLFIVCSRYLLQLIGQRGCKVYSTLYTSITLQILWNMSVITSQLSLAVFKTHFNRLDAEWDFWASPQCRKGSETVPVSNRWFGILPKYSVGYRIDCTPGNGICPNLARMRVGRENDNLRDSGERRSGCGILLTRRKCAWSGEGLNIEARN